MGWSQTKGINFQAVLKKPDGTQPNAVGITVTAQILDPNNDCVLREEVHSGVNVTNGYLNLVLGSSTATTPPGKNPSPILSILQIMDNSVSRSGLNCVDSTDAIVLTNQTYTPTSNDRRRLRIRTQIGADLIVADFNMRSVPFAVNSEMLNGKTESSFVQITSDVTQANVDALFAPSVYNNLMSLATSSTGALEIPSGTSAQRPGSPSVGMIRYNSSIPGVEIYNGSSWNTIGAGSVASVSSSNNYLSVDSSTPTAPVLTINVGTSANTVAAGDDSRIVGAIQNAGNTPNIQTGAEAAKPTSNGSGRLYISSDGQRIYRDDNSVGWSIVGTRDYNDLINKPAASGYVPSQTGNSGKFLTTDGTNASWAALSVPWSSVTSTPTTLAGYSISDALKNFGNSPGVMADITANKPTPNAITPGKIFVDTSTLKTYRDNGVSWDLIGSLDYADLANKPTADSLLPSQTGNAGKVLTTNGTTVSWVAGGSESTSVSSVGTGQSIYKDMTSAQINLKSLLGTAHQVVVTGNTNDITLSLPQDIDSVASPTFTGLTVSGLSSAGFVKNNASGVLSTGAIGAADLGTGTADNTKYLRGDLTWQTLDAVSSTDARLNPAPASNGLKIPRVKSDGSGYELRTPAETLTDISAAGRGANSDITSMTAVTSVGSSGALALSAGGTNQDVTITPSGTGKVIVSGPIQITGGTPGAGKVLQSDASGNASWATLGGSESTSVSNVGSVGTGVYKQMTGTNIELKKLNAGSNKIVITDDVANSKIDLDVDQTKLSIAWSQLTSVPTTLAGYGITDAIGSSTLTTKGDLLVRDGTAPTRLAVGTDGFVLTADSAQGSGLKWSAIPSQLPSQATNAGKYLTTDGTNASWATVAGDNLGNHTATQNIQLGSNFISGDGGNEGIRIDSAGNVAVGGTFAGGLLNGTHTDNGIIGVSGNNPASGSTSYGHLVLGNNATTPAANNVLGRLIFASANNNSNRNPVEIRGLLTGAGGANGFGGDLLFFTKPDNVLSAAEVMRVTSEGKLGVGTDAPDTKLHVVGASGNTLKIVDGNQANGKVLTSDANGVASWAVIPSQFPTQTGNSGKVLSTDGTNVQWVTGGSESTTVSNVGSGTGTIYKDMTSAQINLKSIAGTTNQINIANNASDITLSLPQNIHSAATPTFGGLTLSNLSTAGFVKNNASGVLSTGAIGAADLGTGTADNTKYLRGDLTWQTLPAAGANPAGAASEVQFRSSGTAFGANANFVWDDTNSRLGIGTSTPGMKLHVEGTSGTTLKIVDGNQANGKVLTSDANGVASWANPPDPTTSFSNQAMNTVFAGPASGANAAPGFRTLVANDIPSLDAAKIGSGTFASARLGSGSATSNTFLRGDGTWADLAAGSSAPALRGTGIQASSAGSYDVSWPSGTVAGDTAVVCGGHAWAVNTPTGWTTINSLAGSNFNGACFYKSLVASDISAGKVTVTTSGSFDGVVGIVVFQGMINIKTSIAQRNGTGSASINLSTDSSPRTTDTVIYFASNRASSTDTVTLGTQQQTVSTANASGAIFTGSPASDGVLNPTFNYSSAGSGNYQIAIVATSSGFGDFRADGALAMTGNLKMNGFWVSNDGDNEGVYVDTAGKVGIGTSSPVGNFTVYGNTSSALNTVLFKTSTSDTATSGTDLQFSNTGGVFANIKVTNPSGNVSNMEFTNYNGSGISTRMGIYGTNGYIGINSTNPSTKLDIVGTSGATLKIVDGNQGAGKVLTSDANGVASWTAISGGESTTVSNVGTGNTIGSLVGSAVTLKSFIGTTNQVSIANNANDLTFSLPQNIHSAATPTFAGLTLSGLSTAGFVKNNASGVLSTGAIGAADLGSGAADNTKYLRGDLTWQTLPSGIAPSTLTTKGDLLVRDGTAPTRLPAGTDNYVLTADSSQATGLKWAAAPGDNLGNHTASQNIILGTNWLSGDGGNEGIRVDSTGKVGIGAAPTYQLDVFNVGLTANANYSVVRVGEANTGKGLYLGYIADSAGTGVRSATVTGNSVDLTLGTTVSNEAVTIQNTTGNVGIGSNNPQAKLDVVGDAAATGSIRAGKQVSAAFYSGATDAINWDNGNVQSTSSNCSALAFTNMQNGGTYTLIVTDTGTTGCTFPANINGGTAVTWRGNPTLVSHTRNASSHTVYTMLRAGSIVYVSWITGF